MAFREDLTQGKQDLIDATSGLGKVKADVTGLHAKITEMDNSPDKLGPEDKILFAEIVTLANALKASVQSIDGMTPEAAEPPVEPTP